VPYCQIGDKEKQNYLLQDGDLVFARTGATVGKSFLIKGDIPESIFASYLIRLRFPKTINDKYVWYYFQSPFYWSQIIDKQVGTGQPNVNGTKLGQLKIVIPPNIENQQAIVSEIESRLSVCDKLEETIQTSLKQAEILRQSILKKAFSGQLVSQDPNDEPASLLLEKIQAERAKNTPKTPRKSRKKTINLNDCATS
jgi:type I restriction enzyme S subunit